MKILLTVLVIVGFSGIAVFGVWMMGDHGLNHDLGGCIAALQREANCSAFMGSLGFVAFHLDAFKVFSSAHFSVATAMVLAVFIAALVFYTVSGGRLFNFRFSKSTLSSAIAYSADRGFYTSLEQNFNNWFSLHENSPAIF